MRRFLFLLTLCATAALLCLQVPAASRYESAVLSLLVPMDPAHMTKMERDLKEIRGCGGVTWDLPTSKCTVVIDTSVLCQEDLIKTLNQRSPDGRPVVAPYVLPDAKVSLAEIKKILPEMEAAYQKSNQPKDLLPFLAKMGPQVEILGEAVRQKEPPTKGGKMGPTYEKARELAVRVYVLQSAAKRDYAKITEKALADLRAAVENLGAALETPAQPATP